jgi:hypothetical protein
MITDLGDAELLAARVKLSWRAAASKALSALSGGKRRAWRANHEKN